MTTTYEKRESVLEREPRRWRIEPGALVEELPGGRRTAIAWDDVEEVRLRFDPTQYKSWRHVFSVYGAGATISFDNGHYLAMGEFEDRSASFSPFVSAVLDKVRSPRARLYAGATPLGYAATAVPLMLGLGLLLLVLWNLPVDADAGGGRILERLFAVAVALPLAGYWAVRSWPRQATRESLLEMLPGRTP